MSEYRSQHEIDLQKHPASMVLVLLLIAAGFALAAGLINKTITKPLWAPYLGKYSDRIDALVEYGASTTTVFVGSSHILDALHPDAFDAANAELGLPEVTFNAGQYAAVMPIQRNTLQTLEELPLPELRYVFFEPMLMAIPFAFDEALENAFASRNRYFYDAATTLQTSEMRWASDRSLVKRLGGIAAINFVWLIHESNLGVLRDVIAPPKRDYSLVEEAWEKRGYTGGSRAPEPNLDFSNPPEMEKGYRQISETELQVLDSFVATIRRAGAEPIFIFPPTRANLGKQRAVRDAAKLRHPEIMVLDYSFDTNPIDAYFDVSLWLDRGHMNETGARGFSRKLAQDWRTLQRVQR